MDGELKTIRVLLVDNHADVAEQYVNVLRNKGMATRGQLVESFEDFESNLEKKTWDLILLKDGLEEYPVPRMMESINRFVKDVPLIVITENYAFEKTVSYMSVGVKEVVHESEMDHYVLVVRRELDNLFTRRDKRSLSMSLLEAEKRCNQLIESSRDAVAYVAAGMHVYANSRYLALFGYDEFDELEGIPILDLVASKDQSDMKAFLKQYNVGLGQESSISVLANMPDETHSRVTMNFSQATYDGELCTQLLIRLDEEDADLQDQLKKVSNQDILTGLYNRSFIMETLREVITSSQEEDNNAAFMFLKIKGYTAMQAELGISNCDLVINDAASNLQKLLPQGGTLGHFSDDSFAIILTKSDLAHSEAFIKQVNDFFHSYLAEVQGRTVPVEFSIGAAVLNDSSENPQSVIMQTYTALENALDNTEDNYAFFVPSEKPVSIETVDTGISVQLQQAIESGMFRVLFQPIISLRAQNQPFYEVLLRMLSPEGEEVSPNQFIEEAASQKVAEKIDRWVVVQSIKALAREYQEGRPTRLIINLTSQTLMDESFVPWLGMALKASRLPHDALVFQLAENEAYRYLKEAKSTCNALAALHCKVSISRFGAMANSFNLFRHVHVDYVKIDGSYTKDLANDGEKALVELIEQVHAVGKMTIATFVEEVKVLSSLYGIGVHYIQGYYLQPPAPTMDYDFSGDDDEEEEIMY
ncbi:MAG: EAL domain-containing protein [Pseudomonadota bacterium]|nr:hypothetical protein [Gammaproteobacteria bacterium]MEC8011808.1 EAL domain-containing protein [Pseudomonadota bacterium]HBF07643.1 hypothetical protein [Gammaproteobacteria bacterium]|tara:strand:+ start:122 stop:2224 length:2103 start_codon:yes stop_codon:yes gene_type:complete